MKLTNNAIERLIEEDDPIPVVWDALWDIWAPAAEDISEHYAREPTAVGYERTLLDVYSEFYDILADRCVHEASIDIPDDGAFVVMDAMSVREASLFVRTLEAKGYTPSVGYSFSTVPSETTPYRDRVGFSDLKSEHKTVSVKSQDPSLDGDEQLIWCRYPDALLESIQEGKTELSSLDEVFEKTEQALLSIVEQLDAERIVFGSDHGYVRLDSGHTFGVSDRWKKRLQETFTGGRFQSVGEVDAEDLVDKGYVAEADGFYMPLGRYTWPRRGKYSTYQHGGLSIHECITPRIEITN